MFKNATIYRIASFPATLTDGTANTVFQMFEPCGPSQDKSIGWVPPRGEDHGPLLETVDGHHILKLMTETKAVPGDVLRRKVDEQVQHIEATTGRKPGKKERREITEDARLSLLLMAFAKRHATFAEAKAEAERLASNQSAEYYVLEAVGIVKRPVLPMEWEDLK